MLRAVDAAVRPRAEEKGVKFRLKATRDVAPSDAVGDRARLEQVALQLCENALRFTKEGEICIEMTVAPDADGGGSSKGGDEPESYRLVLAVIDSGVGIKAEQQSTLFSSFARNKASGSSHSFASSRSASQVTGRHCHHHHHHHPLTTTTTTTLSPPPHLSASQEARINELEKDPPPVDPLKAAGGVARGGGAGLGLAICRGVLHLMGGEISVHSEYGRGSRFEATFVLGRGGGNDGGRKSPAAKEEAPTFTISTPSLRILVVEDDDLNWWVVCSMLERHGHRVRRARDGAEAVETVADVLQVTGRHRHRHRHRQHHHHHRLHALTASTL